MPRSESIGGIASHSKTDGGKAEPAEPYRTGGRQSRKSRTGQSEWSRGAIAIPLESSNSFVTKLGQHCWTTSMLNLFNLASLEGAFFRRMLVSQRPSGRCSFFHHVFVST